MQVDVVPNRHQAPLRIIAIDPTCGVGEDHRLDSHTGEDANGQNDFLGGITFVEMHAALHAGHRNVANIADHQTPGVPDSC